MAAKLAPRRGAMRQLGLLGLGWAVALSLVLGVVAGIWLDGRFGTSPLLAVVGTLVGIASAVLTARQLIEQSRG